MQVLVRNSSLSCDATAYLVHTSSEYLHDISINLLNTPEVFALATQSQYELRFDPRQYETPSN